MRTRAVSGSGKCRSPVVLRRGRGHQHRYRHRRSETGPRPLSSGAPHGRRLASPDDRRAAVRGPRRRSHSRSRSVSLAGVHLGLNDSIGPVQRSSWVEDDRGPKIASGRHEPIGVPSRHVRRTECNWLASLPVRPGMSGPPARTRGADQPPTVTVPESTEIGESSLVVSLETSLRNSSPVTVRSTSPLDSVSSYTVMVYS